MNIKVRIYIKNNSSQTGKPKTVTRVGKQKTIKMKKKIFAFFSAMMAMVIVAMATPSETAVAKDVSVQKWTTAAPMDKMVVIVNQATTEKSQAKENYITGMIFAPIYNADKEAANDGSISCYDACTVKEKAGAANFDADVSNSYAATQIKNKAAILKDADAVTKQSCSDVANISAANSKDKKFAASIDTGYAVSEEVNSQVNIVAAPSTQLE